ncbi:unnamed protein product [Prorocentrum cordatum]|uniref:Uncharacterized protein n=1 Tax=Prorocentrum cordatum TaxID=2364126 RepID=A0ABN9UW58_9DINO|nr:unnamed protein product [Polarella glacialis]
MALPMMSERRRPSEALRQRAEDVVVPPALVSLRVALGPPKVWGVLSKTFSADVGVVLGRPQRQCAAEAAMVLAAQAGGAPSHGMAMSQPVPSERFVAFQVRCVLEVEYIGYQLQCEGPACDGLGGPQSLFGMQRRQQSLRAPSSLQGLPWPR